MSKRVFEENGRDKLISNKKFQPSQKDIKSAVCHSQGTLHESYPIAKGNKENSKILEELERKYFSNKKVNCYSTAVSKTPHIEFDPKELIDLIKSETSNLKFKDAMGNNALHQILPVFTFDNQYLEIVSLLIQKGVSPFEFNLQGQIAYYMVPSLEALFILNDIIFNVCTRPLMKESNDIDSFPRALPPFDSSNHTVKLQNSPQEMPLTYDIAKAV